MFRLLRKAIFLFILVYVICHILDYGTTETSDSNLGEGGLGDKYQLSQLLQNQVPQNSSAIDKLTYHLQHFCEDSPFFCKKLKNIQYNISDRVKEILRDVYKDLGQYIP